MDRRMVITLADTTESDVQSSATTNYTLLPRVWIREIVDAAQKRLYAAQFAYQTNVPAGSKDVVIPKRTKYFGSGTTWGASAAEGGTVNYTDINNLSGVLVSPVDVNRGVAISNQAIRTNALDIVRAARDELTYAAGDEVDQHVWNQLASDHYKAASTTNGSQAIYGGDALQASGLQAADTLTTDMVAKGKRYLQSSIQRYWTYGTGESSGSSGKNPWSNEPNSPFVLLIAPEQEEVLLTDSQFVNASEYGDPSVIRNGEIGSYLGVKIVVANNTPYYGASAAHPDGSTTVVAQHRCAMFKANKAVALAWGQKPQLTVFDYPSELEKRMVFSQAYKAEVLHPDAIVHINVSDQ